MTTTDNRHDLSLMDETRHGADDTLDTTFTTLSDPRCRAVVRRLAETDGRTTTVERLAAHLATAEGALDETRATTLLHHSVLPRLSDAGIVERDGSRDTVRYRSDDRFEATLSAVDRFGDDDPAVALDTLLDVLADDRRRRALRTLLTHEELTLPDLADEVAAAEAGEPLSELDPQAVLQVYLSLYHTHVPRLTDTGLVAYDQERDLVTTTETGAAVASEIRKLCDV